MADPWDQFQDAPPANQALARLQQLGAQVTSGFRTSSDVERLKRQGYTPATDGAHNRGDGVDLVPGKSGLSLAQLQAQAQQEFGPHAKVQIHNGTHVHIDVPGWGLAPDVYRSDPWSEFKDVPGAKGAAPAQAAASQAPVGPLTATGQAHDGDTIRLTTGRNGRLLGFDAFELNQQGHNASGVPVPLGQEARDFLLSQLKPGQPVFPTGAQTYGRPVINLSQSPFEDPAYSSLLRGYGVAEPQFLQGSPRLAPYMDAERQARMNELGGFQTDAVTPSQFRHGQSPFLPVQAGAPGQPGSMAVFKDEPMPFTGYRPEVEKALVSIWQDPKGTPEQYIDAGKQFGLTFDPATVQKKFASRFDKRGNLKSGPLGDKLPDPVQQPRPLIDKGDGATGAFARGIGDPFNALDELGAVTDSLGIGMDGPRISLWNAPRGTRFGDIFATNEEQNREILAHDEAAHPYARTAGQLTSGVAVPVGAGLSIPALAAVMAAQGGATGFMGGEGDIRSRLPATAEGAIGGAIAGPVLGLTGEHLVAPLVRKGVNLAFGRGAADAAEALAPFTPEMTTTALDHGDAGPYAASTEGVSYISPEMLQRVNGGHAVARNPVLEAVSSGPTRVRLRDDVAGPHEVLITPKADGAFEVTNGQATATVPPSHIGPFLENNGAELVDAPRSAAMAADRGAEIVGPAASSEAHSGPGIEQAPFGVTRTTIEPLSPEEMAKLSEGVNPEDVLPRPANEVSTLDEAEKANPGRFQDVQSPDENQQLGVRTVTTATGGKVRVRGPFDLTQSVRLMGGVKDVGGNAAHLGLTNAPRRMDFGSNEQFLGKLINPKGLHPDDAAQRLWEEGYFPHLQEPPSGDDLLQMLRDEQFGARYFHPDEQAEVEGFHAAQDQRHAVEQAINEGSPLAEDRTHTINLDDLVANTPPPSAYEDTPRLTGKIGNINLDRLEKPGQVAQLIDQISKRVGGFDASARGRITHEETRALADEIGLTPEDLLKRRNGQALNAEQLYASRALLQRSREAVARLAQGAVGGSDEDLAAFRKAWLKHAALEEQISGATAEAGRALSQFRMVARAQDAGANAVRSYLKSAGGRENIEDAAQAIVDLMKDPAQANRFIRESVKPRWRDKFNELWINSLLSGPRTHAVNFVGNALTTAMSFPELATTAAIGKITRSSDRALFGEVAARAHGLADNAADALRAARTAFRTGEPLDHVEKVENAQHEAIGGTLGKVIRTPTRALTAADEFWKSILSHAELRQIAYRTAHREGGTPEAIQARYEALVRAPTPEMLNQAKASARYWTFQKELGPVGRAVQQISNNWVLGKIIMPFVRTPSNIIKFAGERSIFGLAMPEVRAALRAGGRARDEALARITLGSGVSTAAVLAALDGRVTGGGPSDPHERAALLQSGWQPYSIRVGNRWVSYSRLDPIATLLGVAADFAEAGQWATKKEADKVALGLAMGVAKNLTDKTWLSGLSDAFDVLSDPDRYGRQYFQRIAASMAVPALASQTAQALDPNLHDARTVMDAIKARVPVVSEGVPVRRNVWGEPVSSGDAVGPDIVSPFYASTPSDDPVNKEVARLRVPLSVPQRAITVNGKKVALTPQQFDEYQQLAGHPAKEYIRQQMASPQWRSMTDPDRVQFIRDAISDYRATAREALIQRHPEIAGGKRQAANDPWDQFQDAQ